MRYYSFTNFYLSPIQQGIQTAHCAVDMAMKYSDMRLDNPHQWSQYAYWARLHKTMIVLNGGNQESLITIEELFSADEYPWCSFREDNESLNNCLTSVGIILPPKVYNNHKLCNKTHQLSPTDHQYNLIQQDHNTFVFHNIETKQNISEIFCAFDIELMKLLASSRLA